MGFCIDADSARRVQNSLHCLDLIYGRWKEKEERKGIKVTLLTRGLVLVGKCFVMSLLIPLCFFFSVKIDFKFRYFSS